MLPRQRRAGVATDGARRERMRPWQRPERAVGLTVRPVARARRPPTATELRIPRVALPCAHHLDDPDPATGHAPRGRPTRCPRIRPPNLTRPAIFSQSQTALEPEGQKITPAFIRIRTGLFRPHRTGSRAAADRLGEPEERFDRTARSPPRVPMRTRTELARNFRRNSRVTSCAKAASPVPTPAPTARSRSDARSGRRGSPPGPVHRLRGMRRQFPPARSVQYGGPTHAAPMQALPYGPGQSARPGARPHTRSTPGHLDRGPREGRPDLANQGRPHPTRNAGPGWSARGAAARPRVSRPARTPARTRLPRRPGDPPTRPSPALSPSCFPAPSAGAAGGPHPSSRPPRFLSAPPSLFFRHPPVTAAPPAPHAVAVPTVRHCWPSFAVGGSEPTTIPPYERPPLNGRDAANYAGFTDVLSTGAYSSGLGQMRVRSECRGSSLGRTRYECRAPQR